MAARGVSGVIMRFMGRMGGVVEKYHEGLGGVL